MTRFPLSCARRPIALLLTMAAALLMASAVAPLAASAARSPACSGPSGNAFYQPPSPLPGGPHGDVIRCRAVASPATGARAWRILYKSTTAAGAATAVSGTLLVPDAAYHGTRPVVAYASGTQGWGDQCAPSREMAAGNFDEQFAVNNLLARGWAVVVTDYPGLGTPGDETYNVGIPEGYAVLDALRAATLVPGAGLDPAARMAIEGYSQGGGAADWAAQLQPGYAPGLHLTGVAAGGTPANLQAVENNINGTPFFAFLAGSAIGFNAAYPKLDLPAELTARGKAALAKLDTMCQVQGLLRFAFRRIQDYTVGGINPASQPKWRAVLDDNNLGKLAPRVPLLQYHGLVDEVIPWKVEVTLHRQYCALGVTTQLTGFPGDHVLTQVEAQGDVVGWLAGRLAGRPAPSNC